MMFAFGCVIYKMKRTTMLYKKYIKRVLDIVFSGTAIIVFSPVMGITAILVKKKLGNPILFKQQRPGKDEKIFTMYKFRTMTDERDETGELLPDSIRLTKFGKMLRSTSLDELPELFNIIMGDMSIVGPRPLLIEYLPYYTEVEKERHSVRPGLTGLAQINGRNYLNWEERFKKDVEYAEKYSFILDTIIILKTFIKIFNSNEIAKDTSTIEGNLAKIRSKKM